MAVQEQTPLQEYTANGIAKQFDLEFDCESADHLIVSIDDLEVLHTDWYLSGSAIMFHVAPANGKQVKIQRNTPFNRLADYQSYNNSFRPPAINKDFDRIWWKLQELGVADWILSNRISALKAYVDDRDDELRAYLMEEIRKQGVSLQQLDDYYNYLMERLAQIAVDKGWDASFVVDASGKTQQEVNNFLRDQEKSLLDFIPPQYHASIKNYEYTVDCFDYIQSALDWATLNNRGLFVPAGGYLIDGGTRTLYLVNNWGSNRNLIIRGAGLGLTVFKEAAGKTNLVGRYCKMFYLYYGSTNFVGDFGHIKFSGITFDKNGSSNTNESHLFNYEQAHILSGAGSGTVNIKSIQFDDIELKDKIGGGINFSSSGNVFIGKGVFNNIISQNNPKVTIWGDGTFGVRGDLEFGTSFGVIDINNPQCQYAQIEPVIASSLTHQRHANINGGSIDVVEWTDGGDYSFANLVNVSVKRKFLVRGVQCGAINCTLKITENIAGGKVNIKGGTILLDYDPTTNAITPLVNATASGITGYSELWLSDLSIKIDSDDPDILPTGFALDGGTVGSMGSRKRFLNNVKFDSRIESSINAYGNGDWKITNCDIQGRGIQVAVGAPANERGGSVELINNNYLGTGTKVHVYRNNALWELKVYGTYPFAGFWGSTGFIDIVGLIKAFPVLTSTSRPNSNVFSFKGQPILNPDFSGVGVQYWIKSATGNANYDRVVYNIFGTLAYAGETIAADTRGAEQTITVTGAVLGDAVQVTLDINLSGCVIEAYVSAANTVKARIYNPTAASVTLAAGTLRAKIT